MLGSSQINHLGFSPTSGNGPTQGQRRTLTRVGNELHKRTCLTKRLAYLGTFALVKWTDFEHLHI